MAEITLPLYLETYVDIGYRVNEESNEYRTTYSYTQASLTKSVKLNKPIVSGTSVYAIYNGDEIKTQSITSRNHVEINRVNMLRDIVFSIGDTTTNHVRLYVNIGADSKSVGVYSDTYTDSGMITKEEIRLASFQYPVYDYEDFDINDYCFFVRGCNVTPDTETRSIASITFSGGRIEHSGQYDGMLNVAITPDLAYMIPVQATTFNTTFRSTTLRQSSSRVPI